jgi:hypothetical protein
VHGVLDRRDQCVERRAFDAGGGRQDQSPRTRIHREDRRGLDVRDLDRRSDDLVEVGRNAAPPSPTWPTPQSATGAALAASRKSMTAAANTGERATL